MSENREEILADFQACTGIADVAEAIYYLDETNWDLLRAVRKAMPPDSQSFRNDSEDVIIIDNDLPPPKHSSIDDDDADNVEMNKEKLPTDNVQPSTSTKSDKNNMELLIFNVQYLDRLIKIELPNTSTLYDLKLKIYGQLKITPCRQLLSGWARQTQFENIPFVKLNLPKENAMHLTVKSNGNNGGGVNAGNNVETTEKMNGTYKLHVKNGEEVYNLEYKGTKTILEIKTDVYTITNIAVRNQLWSGWPPNIDDQTMLAMSGIDYPEHDLILKENPSAKTKMDNCENSTSKVIHIDSDDEEYEDAPESFSVDDDCFIDTVATKRIEPLIPENIDDDIVGSITFSEQFTARYGPIHPVFYQGSLDDAMKEACIKPAAERKILAIYLHHDSSVLSNVFCTQLLGYESVMQLFENHFLLWGWDITFETNRTRLQTAITNNLGETAAASLRNIPVDHLPAIVIIMRIRSSTDIFNVIHGNVGVNELLSSLIDAVEVFSEHQRVEIVEEQERAERELVKWEQDEAYRESLAADRAKDEAKRRRALAETEARHKMETAQAEEKARKEALRKQIEANLPTEPPSNANNITKIRFRLPKGENIERRFTVDTPLKILFDFLTVKGFPKEDFKMISSWPRRDLTSLDDANTLEQLKLCPQETVILEER